MQKAQQSLDQLKVQMLSKEAKGECVYTEKEEEIGCLGRGIRAYELKDYAKFWLHEDMQHPQSGGMLSLNLALT